MDILQLEYFLKVAATQHVSQAAEELNISQPALSSNIRKLEAELGVELFDRHGRRLELNSYGKYLSTEIAPILESLTDAFEEVRAMRFAERSRIVIDAEPIYTFYDLPAIMNEVLCTCGGASVKNVRYPIQETFRKIIDNEIDFAVMGIERDDEEIEKTFLSRDELVMLVHKSHPLAGCTYARLSQFSSDRFAAKSKDGLQASYFLASEYCCRQAGFSPRIVFQSPSRNELIDTVRSFHYSMLTPINTLDRFRLDDLSVIHITEPECYAYLWMYRKKGKKERKCVKLLRESILEFFSAREAQKPDFR